MKSYQINFMAFSHNSTTQDDEPDWGSVDKTKLPRVAFGDQGEPDKKSSWKYPHHWVKGGTETDENVVYTNGTMYLHRGGLAAAWASANGGRSGQEASQSVKNHLNAHRKAIGMGDENARMARGTFILPQYRNEYMARAVAAYYGKSLDDPDWYEIKAQSGDEAEILIYDIIGWPFVTAQQFIQDLMSLTAKTITIGILSAGGDLIEANAIKNAIQRHSSKIITRNDGMAASAASIVAISGKERQGYKDSMWLIHEPWAGPVFGNQYDLREVADQLTKFSANMIDAYADGSNVGKREIAAMMKAETLMTAKEAKERGFVDTIIEGGKPAARVQFDLMASFALTFDSLGPEARRALAARDAERVLIGYGYSRSEAKTLLARRQQGFTSDDLSARGLQGLTAEELEAIAACQKTLSIIGGK